MSEYRFLPEGMLSETKENREALSSPVALERARAAGTILEAPVLLCDGEMRLHVDLGCMRGIMPREEAVWCRDGEEIKDIAVLTRVGKPVCFLVTDFTEEDGERVALLSRRRAQALCAAHFFGERRAGDLVQARVTHLENYGAFVDVGCGLASLLSIDCISVSRITHPRDRLACGMYIWVAIRSIDRTLQRIFVTLKELLGTWEENAALFRTGETVTGRVRSIEPYGIFVELTPNLAGLAELRGSGNMPVQASVGDLAAVYIKSILPERMKIKLVIIDSCAAPEAPKPPKYYLDPTEIAHLARWEYSPLTSTRLIETVFDE